MELKIIDNGEKTKIIVMNDFGSEFDITNLVKGYKIEHDALKSPMVEIKFIQDVGISHTILIDDSILCELKKCVDEEFVRRFTEVL